MPEKSSHTASCYIKMDKSLDTYELEVSCRILHKFNDQHDATLLCTKIVACPLRVQLYLYSTDERIKNIDTVPSELNW